MSFIKILATNEVTGSVKTDYDRLSFYYSGVYENDRTPPQVFRTSSQIPAYVNYCAVQQHELTRNGTDALLTGAVPGQLVAFAVSHHSSCFY
jgi:hypothetical protein